MKYSDKIRQTIIELLQQNVAMRNVGPIMEAVRRNLTGERLNQVPSKDVACKILKEANFIAKSQIVREL